MTTPVFICCLSVRAVKLFPVTCEYIKGEKQFYYRAQKFYEDVPASEEGMMGDYVDISNVDLEGSREFLKRFVVSVQIQTHINITKCWIRSVKLCCFSISIFYCGVCLWVYWFTLLLLSLNIHVRIYSGRGIYHPDCTKRIPPCFMWEEASF